MTSVTTQATSDDLKICPVPAPISITVNDKAATREVLFGLAREKGLTMVERSSWHAKPGKDGMAPDWNYTMIAIHHAGRSSACSDGAKQIANIQDEHLSKNYDDIGYHFGIDCSGTVYEARDIRLKGSNVHNYNTGVIGIVLLEDLTTPEEGGDTIAKARTLMEDMGFSTQNVIPETQITALTSFITVLKDLFFIRTLGGHREFPMQLGEGKICPGNIGLKMVQQLRAELNLAAPPKE